MSAFDKLGGTQETSLFLPKQEIRTNRLLPSKKLSSPRSSTSSPTNRGLPTPLSKSQYSEPKENNKEVVPGPGACRGLYLPPLGRLKTCLLALGGGWGKSQTPQGPNAQLHSDSRPFRDIKLERPNCLQSLKRWHKLIRD